MTEKKFNFVASRTEEAENAKDALISKFGDHPIDDADVVIALGGDGFMLETLHATQPFSIPVYGMNRGTVGFLMNEFGIDDLPARLAKAECAELHPLRMRAMQADGNLIEALAINEVSLLRHDAQAAKLSISIDGQERMRELVCDGALLSTPAGSTAYNYSARGPIVPIGAEVLALTAMSAYRPRRWRGALLPRSAKVRFDVREPEKRPVVATADGRQTIQVVSVEIESAPEVVHKILFDPGHGLEERLLREQFV